MIKIEKHSNRTSFSVWDMEFQLTAGTVIRRNSLPGFGHQDLTSRHKSFPLQLGTNPREWALTFGRRISSRAFDFGWSSTPSVHDTWTPWRALPLDGAQLARARSTCRLPCKDIGLSWVKIMPRASYVECSEQQMLPITCALVHFFRPGFVIQLLLCLIDMKLFHGLLPGQRSCGSQVLYYRSRLASSCVSFI